jgi:cholesterol transport system auxiliary component
MNRNTAAPMKVLAAALLAASLAACAPFGSREAHRYFVLEPPQAALAAQNPSRIGVRLGRTTASSFYDTDSIAFSRAPGTRGYYQYNSWTERPARRIGELLVQRLGAGEAPPRLVLNLHLHELYHDAAVAPGLATVSLAVELVDPRRGVVGRKVFASVAPAPAYDAPGAVQAFNAALGQLLDEASRWVADAAPP